LQFHQLRYFVAAAELVSFTAAAKREHVTQPALSRQIALLETQLGVKLFERTRQRVVLTEAGRWFLPRARQLLCDAATGEQQLRELFAGAPRTLRLGCIAPMLDDLVAPAVRELKKKDRRIMVSLFDLAPRAQLERLAAHELDAAIVGNLEAVHREQFAVRRLSRHRFAAVLPDTHAAAGARPIPLASLRNDSWVSLTDAAFPGRSDFLRAACARDGFAPRIVAELDSVAGMLSAVASGDGVAIAPLHAAKLPHAGCTFVRLAGDAPVGELVLVLPRRGGVPELVELERLLAAKGRELSDA